MGLLRKREERYTFRDFWEIKFGIVAATNYEKNRIEYRGELYSFIDGTIDSSDDISDLYLIHFIESDKDMCLVMHLIRFEWEETTYVAIEMGPGVEKIALGSFHDDMLIDNSKLAGHAEGRALIHMMTEAIKQVECA